MGKKELSSQLFNGLLFPKIFRTFRMAIHKSNLTIAFLAVVTICTAGWIMDVSNTVVLKPETSGTTSELQIYINNPNQVESFIKKYEDEGERRGVFSTLWDFGSTKFHGILNSLFTFDTAGIARNIGEYFKAVGWVVKYHLFYCIIFFGIKLAVISIAGGSICRIATLQFAQSEKPGLSEALDFGFKKFASFFAAPLIPMMIIVFIGFFIFVLGLIGNLPWVGEITISIFTLFALGAGALITIILIGTVAGFNLMFPAIAYEHSDCFDSISRALSYVYTKPWRMGFYSIVAGVYGAICYTFVRFFAFLMLLVTHSFMKMGVFAENGEEINKLVAIWPRPSFTNLVEYPDMTAANWSQSFAGFVMHLSLLVVIGLVVSFIISFYFSANTVIYSLMRNQVDGVALEEIDTQLNTQKNVNK